VEWEAPVGGSTDVDGVEPRPVRDGLSPPRGHAVTIATAGSLSRLLPICSTMQRRRSAPAAPRGQRPLGDSGFKVRLLATVAERHAARATCLIDADLPDSGHNATQPKLIMLFGACRRGAGPWQGAGAGGLAGFLDPVVCAAQPVEAPGAATLARWAPGLPLVAWRHRFEEERWEGSTGSLIRTFSRAR
jgi:hypothetical protein